MSLCDIKTLHLPNMTLPQLISVSPDDFALPSKLDAEGAVFVGVVGAEGAVDWKVGKLDVAAAPKNPISLPAAQSHKQVDSGSPVAPTEAESGQPSRWVEYQNEDSDYLLRDVVKYTGWGGHDAEVQELEKIFKTRFPGQIEEFRRAKKEGEVQFTLWYQLDTSLVRFGPESKEALDVAGLLTTRWPFLDGKVKKKFDVSRRRRERVQQGGQAQASSVVARGDHRLGALHPTDRHVVLIDETGKDFGGTSGPEGRFVAIIAPEGVLREFKIHAADATPEECDCVLQDLLDKETAVLGVRLSDLPPLEGDRWYDGVLELLFWIARVIPLPSSLSPVNIEVVIEQRGSAEAGDRWPEASRAIIRSLLAVDAERASRLNISISVGVKDHPYLSYADVVAHAWSAGSATAASRLRASGLSGQCLPNGDTRIVREAWDSFGASKILSEIHWRGLLAHPDAGQKFSLAGGLLARAGEAAAQNLPIWITYLSATKQHLESKRIDLRRLSKEVSWLEKWKPSGISLPLDIEFMWTTAQIAEGNHFGSVAEELVTKLNGMGDQLLEERAPLLCWADLHRAVTHTNRFEFDKASDALARWKTEPPRVPGLQLWGRIQSSLGQHASFQGQHLTARAHFARAMDAFGRLSDQEAAKMDITQTATYFAINEMDNPASTSEDVLAALERVTGPLERAVPKLAKSASRADQYIHHVLLRWMVISQASGSRQNLADAGVYLAAEPEWKEEYGHPWPLILCYRAMLLPVGGKSKTLLEKAVASAWHDSQKGTVRLIGATIAAIAESRGSVFPTLDGELEDLQEAIPAARNRIEYLSDWREKPSSEMGLLRKVLPFNFH